MNDELQDLLRSPREDLDIELKQWMDPGDKVVQAKLAKELLALRNHGGGYLLIGFKDEHPPVADPDRPANLYGFSTDFFNNVIKKYAEPPFHCMSHVVEHPVTGESYPVVVVPGGAKVPVRCKADSPDGGKSAKIDTYYIRRPGPESSAPQSGAEWDALLERCLLNRREELMATISGLLGAGRTGPGVTPAPAAHPFAELRAFRDAAILRLEELQTTQLPEGDPARFEHGRYILSAHIVGDLKPLTPKELLAALSGLKRYTGWPPLYVFTRPDLEPYPLGEDLIECWLARDDARDTAHADFWRVSTNGFVTLVRGHQEDTVDMSDSPSWPGVGKGVELTLPPWRIAEFLLRVRELGGVLAAGPFRLQLIVEWQGLAGRRLFSHGNRRSLSDRYVAHDDYRAEAELAPEEVDAAMPQVLAQLATPLLRRFSFFEPPTTMYEQEFKKLMNREFA